MAGSASFGSPRCRPTPTWSAKILVSMATTVPSIVIVLLLGRFYGDVHLPVWQWLVVALTIWFGATIFAALAVAIGYRYEPDQVQPIAIVVYFVFSILGGLLVPAQRRAAEGRRVHAHLPAVKIGTDVIANAAWRWACDRPGGLARDLRRAGHSLGPRHRGDRLTQ